MYKKEDEIEDLKKKLALAEKKVIKLENSKKKSRQRTISFLKRIRFFVFGTRLERSIQEVLNQYNKNSKVSEEAISELLGSVFRRFTRIGFITILIGALPTFLLFQQNRLIKGQNEQMIIQSELIEASRRSSQVFLMSDILSDLNDELNDKNNTQRSISNTLIGRIIGLSKSMKPYYNLTDFDKNIISPKTRRSPERGQLFISLISTDINENFMNSRILSKCDFSYAELIDLKKGMANLRDVNLSFSIISSSELIRADFSGSNLIGADFILNKSTHSNFSKAKAQGSDFSFSDLRWSVFEKANFRGANFKAARLSKASFDNSFLYEADFSGTFLDDTSFFKADFDGKATFHKAVVIREDWISYMIDSLQVKGGEFLKKYKLEFDRESKIGNKKINVYRLIDPNEGVINYDEGGIPIDDE